MSGVERFDPHTMPLDGLRLVEASAGTGKTFSLAGLYLRLLLERRLDVREILVMTFTRAATQELRERIRARLALAARLAQAPQQADEGDGEQRFILRALADARVALAGEGESDAAMARRLQEAAARMDEATITTIHGFAHQAAAEHAFDSALPFDRGAQVDDGALHGEIATDYWRGQVFGRTPREARAFLNLWPTPEALHGALAPLWQQPHIRLAGPDEADIVRLADEARRCWQRDRGAFATLLEEAAAGDDLMKKKNHLYDELGEHGDVETLLELVDEGLAGTAAGWPALPGWLADLGDEDGVREHFKKRAVQAGRRPDEIEAIRLLAELQPLGRLAALREAHAHVRAEAGERKRARRQFSFADMIEALHGAVTDPVTGPELAAALHRSWPWALVDEFQDTDPRQYEILRRIYPPEAVSAAPGSGEKRGIGDGGTGEGDRRERGGLILIGDPKQAIYGFRGGDVFAYLRAGADAHACYGLETNYRSTGALLTAVERLFAMAGEAAFIIERIRYHGVKPGRAEGDRVLLQRGEPVPAMTIWPLIEPEPLKVDEARRRLREATVARIAALLESGAATVREGDGERAVRAGDIAVLVNRNREAAEMQATLSRHGIAAVCLHNDSVFSAPQAGELLEVLRAAATPADEDAVRVALATVLLGRRQGDMIALLEDEQAWQAEIERFQAAHERWREAGVHAMLEPLLQEAAPRLLALEDGERRMTNYLQLAELLQQAERETFGMAGQIRWLAEAIAAPGLGAAEDAEAAQLRLESDDALVRIATVHKVKGLQYPIVFLPYAAFLGSAGQPEKAPFAFHDEHGDAWLDPGSGQDDAHRPLAVREARAEAVRLLYVAVTRAEQACFLGWGVANTAADSALAWLLHRADGADAARRYGSAKVDWLQAETVQARLESLVGSAEGTIALAEPPRWSAQAQRAATRQPPDGAARTDWPAPRPPWSVFSFSRLVRGAHHGEPRGGADDEARDGPDPVPGERRLEGGGNGAGGAALETLRGAAFGSALHEMLEMLDFARWPEHVPSQAGPAALARQALRNHGVALPQGRDGDTLIDAVVALITRTLQTPVPDIGPLARLPRGARRAEMGFFLGLGGGRLAPVIDRLRVAGYAAALPSEHSAQRLRGLMQGYIDLVVEAQDRYYVLDYKSNHLGPSMRDYTPEALTDLVRRGHYDLQYLIYLVALHRHLGECLPGYEPARHIGGVRYLFLRGMNGRDAATGIYAHRPDPELILELDALLGRAEASP